jgi:predicted MFS family arabinose efflux permease
MKAHPSNMKKAVLSSSSLQRDWVLYAALTFCFAFGFAVYSGIFQNFIREELHVDFYQLGVLESVREAPGLLAAFLAGPLVALAEPRIASFSLFLCGAGIAITGNVENFHSLVLISVIWSIGFHLWLSVSPAITIALARGKEEGKYLGRMAAIGSIAVLAALGFTRIIKEYVSYAILFRWAGGMIIFGALLGFWLSHAAAGGHRKPLVFRREYRLYYLLTFLEGCRRQIFMTFASFTLIRVYHTQVETMLTLAFINACVSAIASPVVGRWIDHYGEKFMLTLYYSALVVVFAGYATTRHVSTLYGLFLLDNLLFSFGVGITTFLHRIVREGEMTPSLAMGTTMNHIAAVLVPITGGLVWKASHNYHIPFWIGVGVVLLSLVATQRIRR